MILIFFLILLILLIEFIFYVNERVDDFIEERRRKKKLIRLKPGVTLMVSTRRLPIRGQAREGRGEFFLVATYSMNVVTKSRKWWTRRWLLIDFSFFSCPFLWEFIYEMLKLLQIPVCLLFSLSLSGGLSIGSRPFLCVCVCVCCFPTGDFHLFWRFIAGLIHHSTRLPGPQELRWSRDNHCSVQSLSISVPSCVKINRKTLSSAFLGNCCMSNHSMIVIDDLLVSLTYNVSNELL